MTQLSFSDIKPPRDIFLGIAANIVDDFYEFIETQPGAHHEIYSLFSFYAYQVKKAGKPKFGSKGIFERIRWFHEIERRNGEFSVNNNFSSCYARLLMFDNPSFKDFFETRSHRDLKAA